MDLDGPPRTDLADRLDPEIPLSMPSRRPLGAQPPPQAGHVIPQLAQMFGQVPRSGHHRIVLEIPSITIGAEPEFLTGRTGIRRIVVFVL